MATDMEREIRELLAEQADDVRPRGDVPVAMLRRARRRRIGTAFGSAVVVVGVVAAAVVGTRALLTPTAAPNEVRPAGPERGTFAVWPQTTREEAEAAQRCADAGREECMWQLNALEVVRRYGEQELGWQRVFAYVEGFSDDYLQLPLQSESEDIGLVDVVDPLTIRVSECPPTLSSRVQCEAARVAVEKLLRPDVYGIWLITSAESTQHTVGEVGPWVEVAPVDGLDRVLEEFIAARANGSGAERFLSDRGLEVFSRGSGLGLYFDGAELTSYELARWRVVPETSEYKAVVRMDFEASSSATEQLTIGIRPDAPDNGPPLKVYWIVGARMLSAN